MLPAYVILPLVACVSTVQAGPILPRYANTTIDRPASKSSGYAPAHDSSQTHPAPGYGESTSSSETSATGSTPSAFGEGVLAASGGMDWAYLTVAHTITTTTQAFPSFSYAPTSSAEAPASYGSASSSAPSYANSSVSQPPMSTTIFVQTTTVYSGSQSSTVATTAHDSSSQPAVHTSSNEPPSYPLGNNATRSSTILTLFTTVYPSASSSDVAYGGSQQSKTPSQASSAPSPSRTLELSTSLAISTDSGASGTSPTSSIGSYGYNPSSASSQESIASETTSSAIESYTYIPPSSGSTSQQVSTTLAYPLPSSSHSPKSIADSTAPSYSQSTSLSATYSSSKFTGLPSIITGYPTSSETPPAYTSLSDASSSSSTTYTPMPGITIIPIDTNSNTVTVTVTVTDPGVTTTVTAGPTVTVTA